jgi:drug/metabolite transporter (DMT)-like permease
MKASFLPMAMAVLGGVLYHVAQKAVPRTFSPFAAIIIAYLIGSAVCAVAMLFDATGTSFRESLKAANWAVLLLGVAALMIEIGVLLVYRAGWEISLASVVINISVAAVLVPLGVLVFKEQPSLRSLAGIACCLLGLYLLSKR